MAKVWSGAKAMPEGKGSRARILIFLLRRKRVIIFLMSRGAPQRARDGNSTTPTWTQEQKAALVFMVVPTMGRDYGEKEEAGR